MIDRYECQDWDYEGFPSDFVLGDETYVPDEYMGERWKFVDDNPQYRVSDKGRVHSGIKNRIINGTPTGRAGHIDLSLRDKQNNRIHRYMHRLVAQAFIPNPGNLPLVRHLDDDPSNNYKDNLAWGIHTDNMQDAIKSGHFYFFTKDDLAKAVRNHRAGCERRRREKNGY